MLDFYNDPSKLFSKIQKITRMEPEEFDDQTFVLEIPSSQLVRILTILNTNKDLLYKKLVDIVVIDRFEKDRRFEINYIIASNLVRHRLNIRIELSEDEKLTSVDSVYPSAYYMECEMFELFGISFYNNQKLRRLFTKHDDFSYFMRKSNIDNKE